jgi:hypothetical protein
MSRKLLQKIDVYRKIDPELTRGTALGALVSVSGIALILGLFFFEVYAARGSTATRGANSLGGCAPVVPQQ